MEEALGSWRDGKTKEAILSFMRSVSEDVSPLSPAPLEGGPLGPITRRLHPICLASGFPCAWLFRGRFRPKLAEALGATELRLTTEDLGAIERTIPRGAAAGDRYHAPQMASLDSELGGTTAG